MPGPRRSGPGRALLSRRRGRRSSQEHGCPARDSSAPRSRASGSRRRRHQGTTFRGAWLPSELLPAAGERRVLWERPLPWQRGGAATKGRGLGQGRRDQGWWGGARGGGGGASAPRVTAVRRVGVRAAPGRPAGRERRRAALGTALPPGSASRAQCLCCAFSFTQQSALLKLRPFEATHQWPVRCS